MKQTLSPETRRDLVLSLNTHRTERPLSPIEVAEAFGSLLSDGASFNDIASLTGFQSTSTLREIARLTSLDSASHHLVGWGRSEAPLSMTTASQIARLTQPDQGPLIDAVLVHDLTSKETRYVAETRLRSGKSIVDSIALILDQRPVVIRRYLFLGAITSAKLTAQLAKMTQRQRDDLLNEAASRLIGSTEGWTANCSPTRFTLVGGEEFFGRLEPMRDGFEAAVNGELLRSAEGAP